MGSQDVFPPVCITSFRFLPPQTRVGFCACAGGTFPALQPCAGEGLGKCFLVFGISVLHVQGSSPWLGATGGVNFEIVVFLNLVIFNFCHKSQTSVFHGSARGTSCPVSSSTAPSCCLLLLGVFWAGRKDRDHTQWCRSATETLLLRQKSLKNVLKTILETDFECQLLFWEQITLSDMQRLFKSSL